MHVNLLRPDLKRGDLHLPDMMSALLVLNIMNYGELAGLVDRQSAALVLRPLQQRPKQLADVQAFVLRLGKIQIDLEQRVAVHADLALRLGQE